MRLFVAVWPPPRVEAALAALPRPAVDGVHWTSPDQWHVTLRFLGEVADPAPVGVALRTALAPRPPAEAVVGPRVERLGRGVLCAPVAGLAPLADAVADAVRAVVPDAAENRPFRGHITLARSRRRLPGSLTGAAVAGRWTAAEVALVCSHLSSGPARYEVIERFGLGG